MKNTIPARNNEIDFTSAHGGKRPEPYQEGSRSFFIFGENLDFGFDYILRMRIKIIYGIRQRPPESSGGKAFMSVRGQKKLEMGGGAYLASE